VSWFSQAVSLRSSNSQSADVTDRVFDPGKLFANMDDA
jgi:hypothetical protein